MSATKQSKFLSRITPPGLNTIASHDAVAGATSFPKFPKLPAELQHKIWHYAAHLPRTITLEGVHDPRVADFRFPLSLKHNARTVLATMHACHDSRKIALNFYQVYNNRLFHSKGFYINYAVDTLLLWDWWTTQAMYHYRNPRYLMPELVELEKNIKLIAVVGHYPRRAYADCLWVLKRFWRVDELVLECIRPEYDDQIMRSVRAWHQSTLQEQWGKLAKGKRTPALRIVDEEAMVNMRAEQEVNWLVHLRLLADRIA